MSDHDKTLEIPPKDAPPIAPPEQHGGDVDIQAIGRFLFSMVVGLALVCGAMYGYVRHMQREFEMRRSPADPLAAERAKEAPLPRLQPSPDDPRTGAQAMRAMREEQEAALRTTAWADNSKEFVIIPIERAMEIVARDGAPKWPAAAPSPTASPSPTGTGAPKPAGEGARP
jgi:hypothetical protein